MIADNYRRIQEAIADAALHCGRSADEVQLVAVSKAASIAEIETLYALGQRDFGESRLDDAIAKQTLLPADCRWHLVGTLQSKKVGKTLGHFSLIHSVDTVELAEKISRHSQERGVITHVLLQSNTSGELSKHGLQPKEWECAFDRLGRLPAIVIDGLMTMAPLAADEKEARTSFAALRLLRDRLRCQAVENAPLTHLSMGMSRDFRWAIAEGATLVRIGSSIFFPI